MRKIFALLLPLLLLCACGRGPEPVSPGSTAEWTYEVYKNQLLGTRNGETAVLFQGDRNGGSIQAVASESRVYLIYDDVLRSMDPDGGNVYQIAEKCYNPGERAGFIAPGDENLHTLGYYGGYIYYIVYGGESQLMRFPAGGEKAELLAKNSASVFSISPDGVLTAYSSSGEETLTLALSAE